MTLVKWNPFAELESLRREIDRMFAAPLGVTTRGEGETTRLWSPRVDIFETDDEFVLHADLPGMKRDEIDVQLHGDTLTLKGERRIEREAKEGNVHHTERAYGAFYRTFTLGTPVDADRVTASYKDGVLEVHVPKAAEAKPKRVEITAS